MQQNVDGNKDVLVIKKQEIVYLVVYSSPIENLVWPTYLMVPLLYPATTTRSPSINLSSLPPPKLEQVEFERDRPIHSNTPRCRGS